MAEKFDFSKLEKHLKEKGYLVSVFENKESASEYLKSKIQNKTVGFGGSVTLREMELFNTLSPQNKVLWHDKMPEGMTVMEVRSAAARSDVYVSSVNGISEEGEIVNIDHTGNRVAAISYGPGEIYLIIGKNKVAPTLEDAIHRARNVAGPKNAQRLNRKTPCAKNADRCYNCNSPERICRNLSVFWEKPAGAVYEIILIDENLGY